jgi:pyruvate formate lyase activating enzyme
MVIIKGLQKTCLIDFEPYISAVVFLGGCNFRCGYCHNPELVLNSNNIEEISEEDFFSFLDERRKWLDGVCISGGEPTIHKDLIQFINKIKEKGLLVKLDTNGYNSDLIKKLIELKLIDYIAMDIKTKLENYNEFCGVKVDISKIKESISIIKNCGIDYEFRTTAIPLFVTNEDIVSIGKFLKGSKKYVIQNFSPREDMIEARFKNVRPYKKEELEKMKDSVKGFFDEVIVKT